MLFPRILRAANQPSTPPSKASAVPPSHRLPPLSAWLLAVLGCSQLGGLYLLLFDQQALMMALMQAIRDCQNGVSLSPLAPSLVSAAAFKTGVWLLTTSSMILIAAPLLVRQRAPGEPLRARHEPQADRP